ncbi:MAG: cytochrome c biogenesis protein ResB, partial [Mucispirillum sp.]|nr:cytochrome c biogenesis protein ResB [Mucispirillum sp.]
MKNFYNLYITQALNILGSIKFAFFLIICLIILAMIGSIISDASIDKIKYNFIISLFFNPSTDEFKDFAFTFGLLNVYTSPLFVTLLFLFTINLLICTFKLFPFAKKGFPFVDENGLKNEIVFKDDVSAVTDFFYKEGWRVSRSPENNIVKAEHNKPGKYGVI